MAKHEDEKQISTNVPPSNSGQAEDQDHVEGGNSQALTSFKNDLTTASPDASNQNAAIPCGGVKKGSAFMAAMQELAKFLNMLGLVYVVPWIITGAVIYYFMLRRASDPNRGFIYSSPKAECSERVPEVLASLSRNWSKFGNTSQADQSDYLTNLTSVCKTLETGFKGQPSVYGLGVRIALYLQWGVSLLGNHVQPHSQKTLADAYILVLLFYCVYGYKYAFVRSCTFMQELEIVRNIFFGGFLCVYSNPAIETSKTEREFQGLTWSLATRYAALAVMPILSLRAMFLEPNDSFSNVSAYPCKSSFAVFGLITTYEPGPSRGEPGFIYGWVRLMTGSLWLFVAVLASLFILFFLIIFPCDIYRSILDSKLVEGISILCRKQKASNRISTSQPSANSRPEIASHSTSQPQNQCNASGSVSSAPIETRGEREKKTSARLKFVDAMKQNLRIFTVPLPLSAESKRRSNIVVATAGILSFVISILNIERTIAMTGITGVQEIRSTSQYLPLVYSLITCFPVLRDCLYHFRESQIKLDEESGQLALHDLEQRPAGSTSQTSQRSADNEFVLSGALPTRAPSDMSTDAQETLSEITRVSSSVDAVTNIQ